MSAPSDSLDADFIPANDIVHPSANTQPKPQKVPGPSKSTLTSCSLIQTQSTTVPGPPVPTNPPEWFYLKSSLSVMSEGQLEVVTAVAIVAIQVQLLTSSSHKTTQALLSIAIILELLAILFAICFIHLHNTDHHHSQPLPTLSTRLALRVPTVLILTGIVGLGTALVVDTLETSLGTAVAMSSFLVFGVALCLLSLVRGLKKVDDGI